MRRLGQYQLRVRTLLLIPIIVAFFLWVAIRALERQSLLEWASYHEEREAAYESKARAPIPERCELWIMHRNHLGTQFGRALTEAELRDARQARQQADRNAAYHRALKVKYTRAARFPWLPVAADPSPPG